MNLSKTEMQAPRSFETTWKLAQVIHHKGHRTKAASYYQQLLDMEPERYDVLVALIALLEEQDDWDAVIDTYGDWLKDYPENHRYSSEAHKFHIDALIRHRGIEAAFDVFRLKRRDSKPIQINPGDLLCCMVIRNEMLRLPYFLDYYRRQGMTKFLVVDNDSADETLAYLLQQPDVYLWHTPSSFNQANCGAAWVELLLQSYGIGHWVLWVDADELLYYPACEERTIKELCTELEQDGKTAYMVVKRTSYERVGGFCVPAASAATWEMCQRIAHHFSVWYEPQLLAHASSNPRSISYRHSRYGLPLVHMPAAIDVASSYLPNQLGEELTQQARATVAAQAIEIAKAYLRQGNYRSAMANLGEGLGEDAMHSQDVNQTLLSFFSQLVG